MTTSIPAGDAVRRFIVENQPVRGHFVRIAEAWRALREHRDYPAPVRELLGQAVSASVLLASTLKFRGTLTLQLQGHGAARLLVSQCTHDFRIRALVRVDEERLAETTPVAQADPASAAPPATLTPELFRALVGEEGRLAVTVEACERDVRYQGIVPLLGASFAECLEGYFASSEQLPTRVRLAADDTHAAGLLIQQLPGAQDCAEGVEARSAWQDAQEGIGAVRRCELLDSPVERVLTRNFGQQDLRLFAGWPVRFECRCDPARVAGLLRALGASEVREVLAELGAVTVTCDFCNRSYRFDAVDVEKLFAEGAVPDAADAPKSVH
ncbi:MAG TPA: Hsp33 family molecular chaperone HslO [Steroidobacteraceae bacterium]|nr:Hsp33 family molecular chaperone HslO [Steroidobacteraceae bacterium]